jgi:predicted transcriptional regulator
MLVREMMKEPIGVQAGETLEAAARKLKNDNIGALPVCQDTTVIGMLTDRDITMRGVASERDVSQMTAREAMSAEVLFCFADDQVEQALPSCPSSGSSRPWGPAPDRCYFPV